MLHFDCIAGCYDNSKPPYENQVIYNFMGNYTVQGLFQHQEIERVVLMYLGQQPVADSFFS